MHTLSGLVYIDGQTDGQTIVSIVLSILWGLLRLAPNNAREGPHCGQYFQRCHVHTIAVYILEGVSGVPGGTYLRTLYLGYVSMHA